MAFIGCIVKIPFNLGCADVLGMLKLLGVLLSRRVTARSFLEKDPRSYRALGGCLCGESAFP